MFLARLSTASTPAERVRHLGDWSRTVVRDLDPEVAERLADTLTQQVTRIIQTAEEEETVARDRAHHAGHHAGA